MALLSGRCSLVNFVSCLWVNVDRGVQDDTVLTSAGGLSTLLRAFCYQVKAVWNISAFGLHWITQDAYESAHVIVFHTEAGLFYSI